MKLLFLGVLGAFASGVSAQPDFGVLVCKNASYTNASIIRVTPAYVVVDYSGGVAEVALTNLPEKLQSQYPYDPVAAAQSLSDESNKIAARAESSLKTGANRPNPASLVGTTQTVTVESVTDEKLPAGLICTIANDTSETVVLLAGLPPGVRHYVEQRSQLIDQLNLLRNTPITAVQPNEGAGSNPVDYEGAMFAAREARRARISALGKQLDILEAKPQKGMTRAYPTGQSYNGMPVWQCGESPNKLSDQ